MSPEMTGLQESTCEEEKGFWDLPEAVAMTGSSGAEGLGASIYQADSVELTEVWQMRQKCMKLL